jgi:hypothetical protein
MTAPASSVVVTTMTLTERVRLREAHHLVRDHPKRYKHSLMRSQMRCLYVTYQSVDYVLPY